MKSAEIIGTGYYVPEEIIPNEFFFDGKPWYFYDKDENKIIDQKTLKPKEKIFSEEDLNPDGSFKINGIKERRKSSKDEQSHDLAFKAAYNALQNSGMTANDIEGIIVASVTQQYQFPSTASLVQEMLGAKNVKEAFDVGNACAGFPLALSIARDRIINNKGPYLVLAVEALTKLVDYSPSGERDINATLFGDGSGAVLVVPSEKENIGILADESLSNPHGKQSMYIYRSSNNRLKMPMGPYVRKHAVNSMIEVTNVLLKNSNLEVKDVDFFNFHQANLIITEDVIKYANLPREKVGNNILKYGNMSAATNAILLAQAREDNRIKKGYLVVNVSFGSGLVTHGVITKF